MIFVLIIIFCFLMFLDLYHDISDDCEITFCSMIATGLCLMCAIYLSIKISQCAVIDQKIQMYTEENVKIETQINDLVEEYMKYEGDTFKELANNEGISLISLYPELKSDELINKQLDLYITNNEKIKTLREQKINAKIYKWWLYFGGRK